MKFILFFLMVNILQVNAGSYAQKITLHKKNESLNKIFKEIRSQSNYDFFYNQKLITGAKRITISVKDASIEEVLDRCFEGQDLIYKIVGKAITVNKKESGFLKKLITNVFKDIEISGKVTDSKGKPIPGVVVKVSGSDKSASTNENGQFKINLSSESGTLVFAYIGFVTQSIPVKGSTTLSVTLVEEITALSEVVVVGYGKQQKRELVGAVSQLNFDETKDQTVGTLGQKIQGKFSGVEIVQSTGRPGQGMSFRIRGAASINAGNQPLFVVDGAPITGDISNINPDEIESISVLKDASSSSLYGARAAGGVIMVTTKRAKAGESKIEVNGSYGIASVPEKGRPPMMNGEEFAAFMKGFFEDKIRYEGYIGGIPADYQNPSKYGEGTNWYNVFLRSAPTQNYSLSLSSATEKSSTAVVLGYFNQQGVVINTGYQRFSGRLNNVTKFGDRVRVGVNIAPTLTIDHNTHESANTDGYRLGIMGAMLSSPIAKAINDDGTIPLTATSFNLFNSVNWYRKLSEYVDNYKNTRILSNAFVEVDLLKGLTFKSSANTDIGLTSNYKWEPSSARGNTYEQGDGKAEGAYRTSNYYSWLLENTLNYQMKYGEHAFEALAGYSAQKYNLETAEATGNTFPDDKIPYLNAAINKSGTSGASNWSLLSYIGKLNYSYKSKYFLQATIRRDGSSRFGIDSKYGYFPSVGASWIVSDEHFMKSMSGLSYFKLRLSYGLVGNNAFGGNYPSIAGLNAGNDYSYVFDNKLSSGKTIAGLGNTLLSWEKTKQLDAGVDIGFFKDRITFSYDYYRKITNGLLYQVDVPLSSGFSSINSNIGEFEFWGHEFSVSSKNLNGFLKWNTNLNVSFNRNIVNKLGTNNLPLGSFSNPTGGFITQVGKQMGQFIGYVFDGVYMNQAEFNSQPKHITSTVGSVRMKDIGGPNGVPDGVVDFNDVTTIGNPNPKFVFGMTNDFAYKNFDLSILLSGSVGGKILNYQRESTTNLDGVFNMDKEMLNRWRSESDPGNGLVPRTLSGTTNLYRINNSSWVFDGSYLTAKNIALGYTFKFDNNKYIKKLRAYTSVQQAFIITRYPGANPEVNGNGLNGLSQGIDYGAYPVPRTISFGFNLGL
ncbi:TonB-dependent receptor [Pedobacter sp. HMWF019]|uniref:TonB-dependent receptor n=1 Tax=Pedobacter sp. HMWF019 TaxID=2056856 RepID=UPI001304B62F|nr:TonB-dependent receptor [Pedobacter sp. HMWF019]